MLVQGNRHAVTKNFLQQFGFRPEPVLFWHLVKLWHWSPSGVQETLIHMRQNGRRPSNWDEFRNFMCSKRMEIMRRMMPHKPEWPERCERDPDCGLNPKSGIENVEKVFKQGPELLGKPRPPVWRCL